MKSKTKIKSWKERKQENPKKEMKRNMSRKKKTKERRKKKTDQNSTRGYCKVLDTSKSSSVHQKNSLILRSGSSLNVLVSPRKNLHH